MRIGAGRRVRVLGVSAIAVVAALTAGCSKTTDQTTASGNGATTSTAAAGSTTGSTTAGTAPASAKPAGRPAKASAGCTATAPSGATPGAPADLTIDVDGTSHPYQLYVPKTLTAGTPAPLVLDLHGLGEKHTEQALVSGWSQLSETEHFIVVTPRGGKDRPTWDSTAADDNPDTAYLKALIAKTKQELCVDETRVYSGGISNGGLESSILACKLPEVAAVGLVSGIVVPDGCKTSAPKPAIIFWGKLDCVLPFYGGLGPCLMPGGSVPSSRPSSTEPGSVPPVEDAVAAWAARNGCEAQPTVTAVSEHVEKRSWTTCKQGAVVDFYVIANGGHTWPGSKVAMLADKDPNSPKGIATPEIDATALMWKFYQQFQTAG